MTDKIIYFDNAATTRKKPDIVIDAVNEYFVNVGASPGRGSHILAIEASRRLYQVRKTVANFFGCSDISNVIFTKNATESANLLFQGLFEHGDHVIITSHEHNAVSRPVEYLSRKGRITYSISPVPTSNKWDFKKIEMYIKNNTKYFIMTLASNLTGQVFYDTRLIDYMHKRNIKVIIDSSQGAGKNLLNMGNDGVDYVIFTGHKDLYGLPGTGGICCLRKPEFRPLVQGGTGGNSMCMVNPDVVPEKYEAGTLNMPGLWSVKAGCEYLMNNKEAINLHENNIFKKAKLGLESIPGITIYGDTHSDNNLPIILFNIKSLDCQSVSERLNKHNICIRSGLHCNRLGHISLGTEKIGAIRVSFDFNNTLDEIDTFLNIINDMTNTTKG